MKSKYLLIGALMLLLALAMAACSQPEAPAPATPCPEAQPCPSCPTCPEPPPPPEPVVEEVPFEDEWAGSPHNDAEAEAFNHWNEDDPAEVPTNCANCHTTQGYKEYVATGAVSANVPAPAGTIQCVACHDPAAVALTEVTFPYVGKDADGNDVPTVLSGLGDSSRCAVCHQGRASKSQVDATIEKFGVTEDVDTVPAPVEDSTLGFINVHYYPAAATLYGTQAKGGYEYDGKAYDPKFRHVEDIETCIDCHDSHTLEVKVEMCAECHEGVATVEDLKNTRMAGSLSDYDGDGDATEGVASELAGLQETLYAGIQEYAKTVAGTGIVYDPAAYPYFFADADGDGAADTGENGPVRYSTWTARLLKAAYNYQLSVKDPGAFAHNAKYIIELLYDSTEDLNAKLGTIDMSKMARTDPGHFAGSTMAFRDWDDSGTVPYSCVKCHTAEGLPMFLKNGGTIAMQSNGTIYTTGVSSLPPSNGFRCTTCHNEADWPNRYAVKSVLFPSGKTVSFGGKDADGNWVADESNLCLLCHQGRSSTETVNRAVAGKDPETPDPKISFSNVHYFAAGATLFGTEVKGAYEFEGQTYVGFNSKHPVNKCKDCHDVHALEVNVESCAGCHANAGGDVEAIRMDPTDWDGDGDTTEGVKAEMESFGERLYAALQAYAKAKGTPIVYDAHSHPYFFVDANEDGEADVDDKGAKVRYNAFTPTSLQAAYNYQFWQKEPGAFTHNPKYILQTLYDALVAVGGDVTGLTRPETPAPAP